MLPRTVMRTGGWDEASPEVDGPSKGSTCALQISEDGELGAHDEFGKTARSSRRLVRRNRWHTLTYTVDCIEGVIRTFVDGKSFQ